MTLKYYINQRPSSSVVGKELILKKDLDRKSYGKTEEIALLFFNSPKPWIWSN